MTSFKALVMSLAVLATALADADTPAPILAPSESQLVEHEHYVNKDGNVIHSPAHARTDLPPSRAMAQCIDSSSSFSLHHRGRAPIMAACRDGFNNHPCIEVPMYVLWFGHSGPCKRWWVDADCLQNLWNL